MEINKIINKDCREYMKTLPSECVDLIIADPPYYGIVKAKWDNQWKTKEEYLKWCEEWVKESFRILKPTGSFYCWGSIGEKSDILIDQKRLIDNIGFHFKDWITWKKQRGMGNRQGYLYAREELLWYVKDNKKFIWDKENQYLEECGKSNVSKQYMKTTGHGARITSIWTDITESGLRGSKKLAQGKGHLTPKPLETSERMIKVSSKKGDLVYIPFAGSGSEIESCINNNRNWIATEINDDYINDLIIPKIS